MVVFAVLDCGPHWPSRRVSGEKKRSRGLVSCLFVTTGVNKGFRQGPAVSRGAQHSFSYKAYSIPKGAATSSPTTVL